MSITIHGIDDVVKELKRMDKEARRESIKSIRAGVKKLRDAIKAAAPEQKGTLKKSIKFRVRSRDGGKNVSASIEFDKEGYHWIYIEFGVSANNRTGKPIPAKPFVYNTRDRMLPDILNDIELDILKIIK